jgi:hypothetical protein
LLDECIDASGGLDSFSYDSPGVGVVSDDVAVEEEGEAVLVFLGDGEPGLFQTGLGIPSTLGDISLPAVLPFL